MAVRTGFDQHVAPGAKTFDAAEIGLSLVTDGGTRLVADDGPDKIVPIREVVVKLRSADVRRGLDVFESGASHAALMDQLDGRRNDSGPGAFSLGGERWSRSHPEHAGLIA